MEHSGVRRSASASVRTGFLDLALLSRRKLASTSSPRPGLSTSTCQSRFNTTTIPLESRYPTTIKKGRYRRIPVYILPRISIVSLLIPHSSGQLYGRHFAVKRPWNRDRVIPERLMFAIKLFVFPGCHNRPCVYQSVRWGQKPILHC